MTAKTLMLAEIRAALDAHSAAVDNFIQWARKHEGDTLQVNDLSQVDAAEKQIKDNTIDYLKALLPVVEAAVALRNNITDGQEIIRPPDNAELEVLLDALNELK